MANLRLLAFTLFSWLVGWPCGLGLESAWAAEVQPAAVDAEQRARAERIAKVFVPYMLDSEETQAGAILTDMGKLLRLTPAQRFALRDAFEAGQLQRSGLYRESMIAVLLRTRSISADYWYYEWWESLRQPEMIERFRATDAAWDQAILAVLSPAQRERWQRELQDRQALMLRLTEGAAERFWDWVLGEQLGSNDERIAKVKTIANLTPEQTRTLRTATRALERQVEAQVTARCQADARLPSRGLIDILTAQNKRELATAGGSFYHITLFGLEAWGKGWRELLTSHLTPAQQTAWQASRQKLAAEIEQALEREADRLIDGYREARESAHTAQLEAIARCLGLSEAHRQEISLELEKGRAATLQSLRPRLLPKLREMISYSTSMGEEKQLEMFQGHFYHLSPEEEADLGLQDADQALWRAVLDSHLSADEQQRWRDSEQARTDLRARAFEVAGLCAIDRELRLSEAQRQRLQPYLAKASRRLAARREAPAEQLNLYNLDLYYLFIRSIPREELRSILDPTQREVFARALPRAQFYLWNTLNQGPEP